ncbi:MAG: hypothetical protein ACREFR_06735, partial [Limisphaerales bacterium]
MSENQNNRDVVGRVAPRGGAMLDTPNAGSGDRAYNHTTPDAGSGDPAYNRGQPADVGRVPSHGVPLGPAPSPGEPPPRRLRRLHRVWPDR